MPINCVVLFFFRRLKRSLENKISEVTQGTENLKVVIAGLSNAYTHYITTFEEYQRQRYEAASTIFGPHTLRAYMEQYTYLTEKMLNVRSSLYSLVAPKVKSELKKIDTLRN